MISSRCIFCRAESEGNLKGILGYVEEDLVSTDFQGDNRYLHCYIYQDHVCYLVLDRPWGLTTSPFLLQVQHL
jgi:hypothetical protein